MNGARPSVVSTRAPICRSGSAIRSIGRERERLVAGELEAALLAGERARQQPHQRAGVAAVERLRRAPAGRAARRRGRAASSASASSTSAPSARTAVERRLGVGRAAEAARSASRPRAIAAEQHGAVRDRLVARDARSCPRDRRRRARSSRLVLEHRRRRRRRSPAPRAAPRPRARLALARDEERRACRRARGERCCSSKSSMLIRSAPSACVISASTPGRSGTWTRSRCSSPASLVRALEQAPPVAATPRRSSARGSPRRPPRARASSCSIAAPVLGERGARARRALSRKMSTQIRGFAPATRVMSRSEPPAAASGS